jgi:von Willebrand factor type A domain
MKRTWAGRRFASLGAILLGLLSVACSNSVDNVGTMKGRGGAPGTAGSGGSTVAFVVPGLDGGGTGGATEVDAGLDGGPVGNTCGNTSITPNRAPVDVFIVLDRSGSMYYSIAEDCYCVASISGSTSPLCANPNNCVNRWDSVKTALSQAMTAIPTIHWGLEMYPAQGGSVCATATTPNVTLGTADSASAVQNAIIRGAPSGNTPTANAITAAAGYVGTISDGLKRAILLATDGAPNCLNGQIGDTNDLPNTLAAITATWQMGIPVYVVGIGPSVGNLDSMAQAGGTNHFYPATSPQQLSDALTAISKIISTTCSFTAPTSPPDNAKVWVYVDKQLVAEDPANGWTFNGSDTTTIVLTGSYCQDMLSGVTSNVQIIFGCKDEPPPPVIP